MGLEVFDFIPDLVDTNPVGATDPVSEGDDHLRGIKFTLQNQWPAIGQNAVTRTALQMNDAALRSEANIFTDENTFQDLTTFSAAITSTAANSWSGLNTYTSAIQAQAASTGVVARISWRDSTGFNRWQLDKTAETGNTNFRIQRLDAAGVLIDAPLTIGGNTGQMTLINPVLQADGSAALPAYAFTSVPNMGMYRESGNILAFAAGGVNRLTMDSTAFAPAQPIRHQADGAATFPMYTFASENNTGMYLSAPGKLGFGADGLETLTIESAQIIAKASFLGRDASQSNPTYAFENEFGTGFFRSAANTMSFTTTGSIRFVISSTLVTVQPSLLVQNSATVEGQMHVDATSDTVLDYRYLRGGVNRWQMRMENDTSNPISANDWIIRRFNDAGTFLDIPFKIERARGLISMLELPTNAGGLSTGMLWRNGTTVMIV